MSKRILLVDGYNVIRSTASYRRLILDGDEFGPARVALVSDVASFASPDWRATVVFDGGNNRYSDGTVLDVAGVSVIFSAYGTDADSQIERMAKAAREAGDEVVVVTSDAQTQWAVMGASVWRMSSAGFSDELHGNQRDWQEHTPSGGLHGRLEDRLPADIREALSRLARGE